jgi:hypothetical protein
MLSLALLQAPHTCDSQFLHCLMSRARQQRVRWKRHLQAGPSSQGRMPQAICPHCLQFHCGAASELPQSTHTAPPPQPSAPQQTEQATHM